MAFNYEYPYTDAQRYNDDWLINKVKELSLDWIETSGKWTETQEAWEELKSYITDYFNNLDVQEEINEKLEAMKADGSLFNIIRPLFDEYQQAIDVLSARMDTFTALGEGSTTGDAELADIRVDYTGHTWSTAGDAVRGVTSQLSSDIVDLNKGKHIKNYTDNMAINIAGDRVIVDEYILSDKIMVSAGASVEYISHFQSSTYVICEFDSDDNFTAYWNVRSIDGNSRKLTTTDKCAYLRATFLKNYFVDDGVVVNGEYVYKPINIDIYGTKENHEEIANINNKWVDVGFTKPTILNKNSGIKYADGSEMVTYNETYTSDYIPVKGGEVVILPTFTIQNPSTELGHAFFDINKNFVSGVPSKGGFDSLGYELNPYIVPENACYIRLTVWDTEFFDISNSKDECVVITDWASKLWCESYNVKSAITLDRTNWIATSRNYILKEEEIEGVKYLYHSNNLGVTWKSLENIVGNITFVHWFSDGTCLICGTDKAYYTKDWSVLTQTNVYDFDGTEFVGVEGATSFYSAFDINSQYYEYDGKEFMVWGDYGGLNGYISRVWYTEDNGQTLNCILKNNESIVSDSVLSVRHFHHCVFDKYDKCLWITCGDAYTENRIVRGVLIDGTWKFSNFAIGNQFKMGQIMYDETYLYFVTDYTDTERPTGIVTVPKNRVHDITSYSYLYADMDSTPFTAYFSDDNGNRLLMPDGIGYKKLWVAKDDFNFELKEIDFSDGKNLAIGVPIGTNYNGDLLVRAYNGYNYDTEAFILNGTQTYNLSNALRNAGYKDFGKRKTI